MIPLSTAPKQNVRHVPSCQVRAGRATVAEGMEGEMQAARFDTEGHEGCGQVRPQPRRRREELTVRAEASRDSIPPSYKKNRDVSVVDTNRLPPPGLSLWNEDRDAAHDWVRMFATVHDVAHAKTGAFPYAEPCVVSH